MAPFKSLAVHVLDKGKLEFNVREWNDEPEGNEILVRHTYSVISPGTELSIIMCTHTRPTEFPRYTGYLNEGIVQAVGPDVTKVKRLWGRWQHKVDYRRFRKNKLKRKPGLVLRNQPKDYGMRLVRKSKQQAEELLAAEQAERAAAACARKKRSK